MENYCPLSGIDCKQHRCALWCGFECGIMHGLTAIDDTLAEVRDELQDISRAMQAQLPKPLNRRHSLDE